MKKLLIFALLGLLGSPARLFAGEPDLRVILTAAVLVDTSPSTVRSKATSYWDPSPAMIDVLEMKLVAHLEKLSGGDRFKSDDARKGMLANFIKQRRQYVGLIHEGKKTIRVNVLSRPRTSGHDSIAELWTAGYVRVDDGGYGFWQIDYDVEAERFGDLSINGEA